MAKYAALVGSASQGAVTTGARLASLPTGAGVTDDRPAGLRSRARPGAVSGLPAGGDRRHQDLAAGRVDWPTLDEAWAAVGEESSSAGWLNDHLTDPNVDAGGSSIEALTLVTALAHRVPGRWVGHAVLSQHLPPSGRPGQGRRPSSTT